MKSLRNWHNPEIWFIEIIKTTLEVTDDL